MKLRAPGLSLTAFAAALAAAGCAPMGGSEYLGRDGVFFQRSATDCGAAALTMVFRRFGIDADYDRLRARLETAGGTDMLRMKQAALQEGLLCEGWRLVPEALPEIPLPAILLLRRHHFVVLDQVCPGAGVIILDPSRGRLRVSPGRLASTWKGESLLFGQPGAAAGLHGRWFEPSRLNRRKTP